MTIGAYAVERDYSHYVSYLGDTVLAVIGTASKGPIGKATVCTSSQDLVNKFGPLKTNCYGLYAGQYFLSQSSKLYFVRAASESAAAATALIKGKNSGSSEIEDAITVAAIEKGTYSNGYKVVVTVGTGVDTYTIAIENDKKTTLEIIKDITIDRLVEGYKGNHFEIISTNSSTASLTPGTYEFTGGNDGIDDIEAADYIFAANALTSESVDMNLCAVPGVSDAAVITSMLTLAESRGDFLYLVDPPQGLDRDGVIAWHNGGESYDHVAFNSSYGALYYDWVPIYDSVNKTRIVVPPSVPVAATIAYSDRVSEVWYAPAGLTRGLITGVLGPVTNLSKADTEVLYSNGNNVNSIYNDPQVGLVLWGQKTLARTNTALDRVNVRRLLIYIKKVISAACNVLTFEPNDRSTWNSFEMKVQPTLESIKNRRGLYEYSIVRGETIVTNDDIDNYRMPCMVMVRPTKAAEEIPIYFAITSTGADFNEVLDANGIVTE